MEAITKALVGDYRPEHVFTLRQSLDAYRYYQRLMAECDVEIERHLTALPDARPGVGAAPASGTRRKPRGNEPNFDLRAHLHRLFGVDLTTIRSWLGHVSLDTTHHYLEADVEMKRRALETCAPSRVEARRYKPPDRVLAMLESL